MQIKFPFSFFRFADPHSLSDDIKLGCTGGGETSLANRAPARGLIVMLLTMG